METGSKRPVTSVLADLQGQFVSNQNLIAAAAVMVVSAAQQSPTPPETAEPGAGD